jgi:3-hydroxy acid dehydrogenase/malonic semialdehyde reductase
MNATVLVTGATAGFGEAIALQFAAAGYRVIIAGRRTERLESVAERIRALGSDCLPLTLDVRSREGVMEAIERLPAEWKSIEVLVNNAGLALGRDPFDEASLDDWDTMLDTNVKGLLYVSRAVIPLMKEKGRGHIINIGSIAGKEVYERGNVYCASKSAVDALSRSMRIDLLPHRIKVTAVHPGAAETEFSLVRFKGAADTAGKVYEGYQPLTADDVAAVVLYCASLPPHVCINDLVITPTQQANAYHLDRSGRLD